VTSQKGGSGKTTLAAHLAVEAERAGDGPAWLIDTDKQGTLSLWHERRESETPQRADVPFVHLAQGLKRLKDSGGTYCFIDTRHDFRAERNGARPRRPRADPGAPLPCGPVGGVRNRGAREGRGEAVPSSTSDTPGGPKG